MVEKPEKPEILPVPYAKPRDIESAAEYQRRMNISLEKLGTRLNKLEADKNKLLEKAYEDTTPLRAEILGRAKALFEFAQENRDALAHSRKSFDLPQAGTIGWYDSPGAIQVTGKSTKKRLETIMQKIRELGWAKKFIREVPSLNKQAMLADAESRAQASRIPGIKVMYGEFCELVPEGNYRVVLTYGGQIEIVPKKKKETLVEEEEAEAA